MHKADLAQGIVKVIDKADLAQEHSSHLLRSSAGVLRFCESVSAHMHNGSDVVAFCQTFNDNISRLDQSFKNVQIIFVPVFFCVCCDSASSALI